MTECKLFDHINSINYVIKENNIKLDPLIGIVKIMMMNVEKFKEKHSMYLSMSLQSLIGVILKI